MTTGHMSRLRVIAEARWPEDGDPENPPLVRGFVGTRLAPLVVHVADRCLSRVRADHAEGPLLSGRTGLVLASRSGDVDNARAVAHAIDNGRRASPLMFFQSVPNAALGHVAVGWGLRGPLLSVCPTSDAWVEMTDIADLIIRSGDADNVLAVHAERNFGNHEADRALALFITARPTAWEGTV